MVPGCKSLTQPILCASQLQSLPSSLRAVAAASQLALRQQLTLSNKQVVRPGAALRAPCSSCWHQPCAWGTLSVLACLGASAHC